MGVASGRAWSNFRGPRGSRGSVPPRGFRAEALGVVEELLDDSQGPHATAARRVLESRPPPPRLVVRIPNP